MGRDMARVALPSALIGLLLGLRRGELSLGDSDVLWATRAGIDILHNGSLPRHAAHSWTAAGRSWVPNSWGWDVVLGAFHDVGGMRAVGVLGVLVTTLLGAVVALGARRIGATPAWTAVVFTAVGLFVLHDLRPRPQVVAYVAVFLLPALLRRVLFADRRTALRAAAALALVQVVWMNLHSSAIVGPVLLAAGGIGLLVADRADPAGRPVARLVGIVGLTALCCLATPYGTALITNVQQVRDASAGLIDEWDHAGFGNAGQILGLVAIAFAVGSGWAAARGRRYDTVGYLLVFVVATASAVRFAPILFLLSIPELAVLAGGLPVRPQFMGRLVGAGAAVLGVFVLVGVTKFGKLDDSVASPRLAGAIPHGCRMVNDYTIGGALLLERPDVLVSVDSRNDMYGRSLLLRVEGWLENRPGTLARIDAGGVNCVLTNTDDQLAKVLTTSSTWRVAGRDSDRTLLLRVTP